MIRESIKDTRGMAMRKYQAAIALENKYGLIGKDILEMGAGPRGGFCRILGTKNQVVALDLPEQNVSINLQKMIRRFIFDPLYSYHLSKMARGRLCKVALVYGDATHTIYADKSFDFIFSEALLEHIDKDKIRNLANENLRLLKLGGIAVHNVGVWTHLEGGHTFGWDYDRPWAHLKDKDFVSTVYLNKLKISDYEMAFEEYFTKENIEIETNVNPIASQLLSEKLYFELSSLGYSKEDLTIGSLRIVARKR